LTADRALAEDLAQDAFARLIGRRHHLREPDAFWTYLRRTIENLSNSRFRHRRVERAYLERLAADPAAVTNVNDELDEAMHRVLLLPQRQRAAIVLRFYEDLSDVQTAAVLGCSAGNVRSLVSRGMTTLREALEGVPR
jgi:RNA polymerase sigma factor (sigma-70 family)